MEKICLVETGDYLLGIDSAAITATMDGKSFLEGDQEDSTVLISPAAFFNQSSTVLHRSEFSVVNFAINANILPLIVDRIVGEITAPEYFDSLPLLYPERARQCCPHIILHDDQPALLLDGTGLEEVRTMLKSDCGFISMGTLRERAPKDATAKAPPTPDRDIEKIPKQPSFKLDAVMFDGIVFWTIGKFLECSNDKECTVTIDELLSEHRHSAQLQGVNNDLLQQVIDKTLCKCTRFHDSALELLKDKMAGTKI